MRWNWKHPILRRRFIYGVLFGLPALLGAQARWLEPNWLKVRRLKLAGTGSSRRIVHFTDLHHKGDRALLARVVEHINAVEPTAVCFTGDLVEEKRHVAEVLELLAGIKAPLYGVPGNHDYWAEVDFAEIDRVFRGTGGRWLMDESTPSPDGRINFIGLSCMTGAVVEPKPGVTNVLLIHYPAWVKKLGQRRYDLALAGHSHGGQVRLPFIGAPVLPWGVDEYDLGLFQTRWGPLHVGAGIGWFFMNLRFRCRPEITVLDL